MVRRLAVVAVLAVALAGCSALSGGGGGATPASTDTVTPMAVPTDTPVETLSPPPGVAPNGSVAPGALLRAHYAALDGRSFGWRLDYRRSVEASGPPAAAAASNATVDVAERRLRVAANGSYRLTLRTTGATGGAVYADDTGTYTRTARANGSAYRSAGGELDYRHYLRTAQTLGRYFSVEAATLSTVERDGRTYYRVHVTHPPRALTNGHAKQTITDYAATAYVTRDGLIRALAVEYEYRLRDDLVTVSLRSEFRAVGATTVTRPEWVAELTGDRTATATPTTPSGTPATTPSGAQTAAPAGTPTAATGAETATARPPTATDGGSGR
ncbi:DUF7537 family lipoprotein [Halosimplex marinum]|uniref:DUF7537 family lipoprotein n=1 Tax=Halosimplex marinum TaxID=3396620 RepID=UPI003F5659C6